jgi:phage baseplate assembly protein gpV
VLPTVTTTLAASLAINWLWAEPDAEGVTIYQYYPSTNDTPGAHISVYRMTKTPEYTVAGNILNNWEINPANNMTLGEDGTYTLTLEGMEIPANYLIEYKVTSDGTWWPQDFNAEYLINEAGIYTLVFTFDPETGNVSLVATKTGNISYNGDVYILGEVNDNGGWFTNKGVQMTRDEENNVYTATITTTGEAYVDPETGIGYSYFSFTKHWLRPLMTGMLSIPTALAPIAMATSG